MMDDIGPQMIELQHQITMILHRDPRDHQADKLVEVQIDDRNYFFTAQAARDIGDQLYTAGAKARGQ